MTEEHVLRNRASWDADADDWVERGRTSWASEHVSWGIWHVPCARPVGLDNSGRQLATARAFQDEFDVRFPLVHGDAERPPFADESFDLAISEYGAAIWCDPYVWIPEAARILRPGGRLVFLGHSYLAMLTFPDEDLPAGEQLQRDHFGMRGQTRWTTSPRRSIPRESEERRMVPRRIGCSQGTEVLVSTWPPSGQLAACTPAEPRST